MNIRAKLGKWIINKAIKASEPLRTKTYITQRKIYRTKDGVYIRALYSKNGEEITDPKELKKATAYLDKIEKEMDDMVVRMRDSFKEHGIDMEIEDDE